MTVHLCRFVHWMPITVHKSDESPAALFELTPVPFPTFACVKATLKCVTVLLL